MPDMLELPHLLISGTLLFIFTGYYLLKSCLVEWSCKKFLRDRVKIVHHRNADENGATGSCTTANGSDKSAKYESKLTSVTKGDLAEISQLMVSQAINILTGTVSLLSMWETRHDLLYSKSPLLVTFVHIPAWYMFYDCYAMFDSYTLRKNFKHLSLGQQLYIFIRKKPGLLFHHAILFLGGYPLVLNYSIRRNAGDFVIALFFLMEFTNPFLSMAMILRMLGLTRTSLYFANGCILLLLWFIIRVLNYPIALLVYAVQYHGWNIFSALGTMQVVCHFFCLLHFGFQTYWFFQIFRISIRTTISKSKTT